MRVVYDSHRHQVVLVGRHPSGIQTWTRSLDPPHEWKRLGHEGQTPVWREPSIHYDGGQDRLVFFGGQSSSANETWFLPLSEPHRWEKMTPSGRDIPPGRWLHATAFDSRRNRVLVFGGPEAADVWALNLGDTPGWEELTPAGPLPSPRVRPSAIYDPVRDRLVIFGGSGFDDTWELTLGTGSHWNRIPAIGVPPARRDGHIAAYDGAGDRMIIYAGSMKEDGDFRKSSAWSLGLGHRPVWIPLITGPVVPEPGYPVMGLVDTREQRLVVIRGRVMHALPLAAPVWHELAPGPESRTNHSAVVDTKRDRMIVSGGQVGGRFGADIWTLSLDSFLWSRWPLSGVARENHHLIVDPRRSRLLEMFGNSSFYPGCHSRDDPWLPLCRAELRVHPLDGGPAVDLERSFYCSGESVVLDPIEDQLVLFGGCRVTYSCGHIANATFIYSNRTGVMDLDRSLTPLEVEVAGESPSPRTHHTMVYDDRRDRMVLFGGSGASGRSSEVWTLSLAGGPAWSRLEPAGAGPPPLSRHAAIYDPVRDRMIVLASRGNSRGPIDSSAVWALTFGDSPVWSELRPAGPQPTGRTGHTLVYDGRRDRMILFGGSERFNSGSDYDLWTLEWGDPMLEVELDLMPGEAGNRLNPAAGGRIPAAILGGDLFDPIDLDPATLLLAGAPPARGPDGALLAALVDVNGDGRRDLCFQVDIAAMDLRAPRRRVLLEARTRNDRPVRGRDRVILDPAASPAEGCSPARRLDLRGPAAAGWSGPVLEAMILVPNASPVRLDLFDVTGRHILSRREPIPVPGEHRVAIRPDRSLASGVYLLRLEQDGRTASRKILRRNVLSQP